MAISSFLYPLPLQLRAFPTSTFTFQFFHMQENTERIVPGHGYTPGRFTRFLWWLSTAEAQLLKNCVIDRNRYAITGMTVMGTWLFATLAWAYFFSTLVGNTMIAVGLGIFMGGIILTIDRSLIKGISRANKNKLGAISFRILLALTIGLFMAQPALLYLFDKEIHVQISLDNEKRKRDKIQTQDSVYGTMKYELIKHRSELQNQLLTKDAEVSAARQNFIAETDGTGGSKKIGLKDIAKAKEATYLKLSADYSKMQEQLSPAIRSADSSLQIIDAGIMKEQKVFEMLLNDGFITRIEALNNLIKNNSAVAFRYYLLVAILMLIELMPVLAKTLLPSGTYDEKLMLQEEMEKTLTQNNYRRLLELKETYNEKAFEQNSDFIKNFLARSEKERAEKMQEELAGWRKNDTRSFDQLWGDLKNSMLTKAEN